MRFVNVISCVSFMPSVDGLFEALEVVSSQRCNLSSNCLLFNSSTSQRSTPFFVTLFFLKIDPLNVVLPRAVGTETVAESGRRGVRLGGKRGLAGFDKQVPRSEPPWFDNKLIGVNGKTTLPSDTVDTLYTASLRLLSLIHI